MEELSQNISPNIVTMVNTISDSKKYARLATVFKSNFGDVFMYQHFMNAPDELLRHIPGLQYYTPVSKY